MKKIAIVYWSGTGNTEAMANEIAEELKKNDVEIELLDPNSFTKDSIDSFDGFAFGCPAMGSEELEETEFEPMFESLKGSLTGKRVALFGSYGWGDGEWMRSWEADCEASGIDLACESYICNETPGDDEKAECVALGKALAS